MREPSDCADMAELRGEIDRIDGALIELLARRSACIDRAVELKFAAGLPARIEVRVDEVLGNVRVLAAQKSLDPQLAEDLWRLLVEWAIRREERELAGAEGRA